MTSTTPQPTPRSAAHPGSHPASQTHPHSPPTDRPLARVRTFVKRGRMSELTQRRLDEHGPAHTLPEGPLVPAEAFGRSGPVVLEIGSGHGAAAVAYAAAHPDHDIVALDVHTPGIARMLSLAHEAGVTNLWAHEGDALDFMAERVADGGIDAVHLFFPDPWPKKKHVKRRFVSTSSLDALARVLRPGGHVLVATDQAFYAEHVLQVVAAHPRWTAERVERPQWRPTAGFEDKGRRAGRAIHELRLDLVDEP